MPGDYGTRYTDAKVRDVGRRLRRIYQSAYQDIQLKTEDFWRRYEAKSQMYLAQVKAGKLSEDDYKAWLAGQKFQGAQWKAKADQIAQTMVDADKIAQRIIDGEKLNIFAANANYIGYSLENGMGIDIGFGLYDSATVARLVKSEPDLLPAIAPEKVEEGKDVRWYQKTITSSVTQGIIQGESIQQIVDRVTSTCRDRAINAATRDVRTAYTGAQNAGRVEGMRQSKQLGINVKKKWMATFDFKTRDTHRELDGQEVDVDDDFVVDGDRIAYPGDRTAEAALVYNCRCTLGWAYPEYKAEVARADNTTGENVGAMTYREWETVKQSIKDFKPVELVGGKGDSEITDEISDYFLPMATRNKLNEIKSMSTYNEFRDYLYKNYGIQLDTGLDVLKDLRANDSIPAVSEECRKITTAIDSYRETFGSDALSSLKKVYLYDKNLDVRAAYYFNRVGENDPLAGEIHFSQWGDDGRTIFHELAHAFQDSHKLPGEDAITYSERIIRELDAEGLSAYAGASKEVYAAEQFADAFGYGFAQGTQEGLDFISKVAKHEYRMRRLRSVKFAAAAKKKR